MDLPMSAALSSTLPTANLSACGNCGQPVRNRRAHQCKPGLVEARQLRQRFTALYAEHLPRITAIVRREVRGNDRHLADDLTADAFYRAWLDLHKCQADTDEQTFAWLATIARNTVGQHYRIQKHTAETPADTGDFQFANREMESAGGVYTPAATGFRTARTGAHWDDNGPAVPRIPAPRGPVDHQGDSDPDADELLRRARESKPRALAGAR